MESNNSGTFHSETPASGIGNTGFYRAAGIAEHSIPPKLGK